MEGGLKSAGVSCQSLLVGAFGRKEIVEFLKILLRVRKIIVVLFIVIFMIGCSIREDFETDLGNLCRMRAVDVGSFALLLFILFLDAFVSFTLVNSVLFS